MREGDGEGEGEGEGEGDGEGEGGGRVIGRVRGRVRVRVMGRGRGRGRAGTCLRREGGGGPGEGARGSRGEPPLSERTQFTGNRKSSR